MSSPPIAEPGRKTGVPGRTKFLAVTLGILVLLAGGRLAFQVLLQDRLAYNSRRYVSPPSVMGLPGSEFTPYRTADGRDQLGFRIDAPPSAPQIPDGLPAFYLFFYGGGSIASNNVPLCSQLALTTGASFFIVEYRGHGYNDGRPGAAGYVADAVGAYDTLLAQGALSRGVGVIGHSLGVGVSLALAEERPVNRMVLVSGATSLMEVARLREPWPVTLLLREDWPNEIRLHSLVQRTGVGRPGAIAILHGARDELVPVDMASRLAAAAGEAGQSKIYQRAAHNDIFNFAMSDIAHFMRGGTL